MSRLIRPHHVWSAHGTLQSHYGRRSWLGGDLELLGKGGALVVVSLVAISLWLRQGPFSVRGAFSAQNCAKHCQCTLWAARLAAAIEADGGVSSRGAWQPILASLSASPFPSMRCVSGDLFHLYCVRLYAGCSRVLWPCLGGFLKAYKNR